MRMVESVLSSAVDDLHHQEQQGGGVTSAGVDSRAYQYQDPEESKINGLESNSGGDRQQLLSISDVLKSAASLATALDDNNHTGNNTVAVELHRPDNSENTQMVLHFATPAMVEHIEIIEEAAARGNSVSASLDIKMVPVKFQLFAGLFGFFYCGLFYSYSGWVTSYASGSGIASTPAAASYLTSQYFLWVTVGSALSVPMSVLFSTSFLLRFQLTFVMIGALLLSCAGSSYDLLNIATATLGFGNSCIFPLLICVANDYKFTM
jgi:hypothetical protein